MAPEQREDVERAVAAVSEAEVSWIGGWARAPPGAALLDSGGEDLRLEGFEHRW